MQTTGFFSAGATLLPATLPLSQKDLENLTMLSFVRVFLAPVAITLVVFPLGSAVLYGPLSGLASFLTCLVTVLLSIGALLHASKWFSRKMREAPSSRAGTAVRVLAGVGAVVGMLLTYMMMNFIPDLIMLIGGSGLAIGSLQFTFLSLVFPFSFGIFVGAISAAGSLPLMTFLTAAMASALYVGAGIMVFGYSRRTLKSATLGGIAGERATVGEEIGLEVVSPTQGLIRKDMRLVTRSLGSLSFFILPIVMAIIAIPIIAAPAGGLIRSMNALSGIVYASSFAGIGVVGLLSVDTEGASVYDGTPLSSTLTLKAKAYVFQVTHTLSMVAVAIVLSLYSLTTAYVMLIPVAQIPVGIAVAMSIGGFIFGKKGGGRVTAVNMGSDQIMMFQSLFISGLISVLPLVGYGLVLLQTGLHVLALLTQGLVATLAAVAAFRLAPRMLLD
jgi:hypothetical protein